MKSQSWHVAVEIKNRYDSFTGKPLVEKQTWIRFSESEFDNIAIICNRASEKDAHLIAAAPEMLEALTEIADEIAANLIFDGKSNCEKVLIEMLKRQRELIKKARGV